MDMSSLNPFLLNTTGSSVTAFSGTVMTIPSHCRQHIMIKLTDQEAGSVCAELEYILLEQLLTSGYFMDVAELPEVNSNLNSYS